MNMKTLWYVEATEPSCKTDTTWFATKDEAEKHAMTYEIEGTYVALGSMEIDMEGVETTEFRKR